MKAVKSILVSPAKLRAIADRLVRQAEADASELRRLADMAEGLTRVATKAKPKKAKKAAAKKTAKKAPARKAAKKKPVKTARKSRLDSKAFRRGR